MLDFFTIATRTTKSGTVEVYPKFIMGRSDDLMIRGGDFYAIWNEERGLWSTDELDVIKIIDRETTKYIQEHIHSIKVNKKLIDNANNHHVTAYKNAPSIMKYGLLTLRDLNDYKIINLSDEQLVLYDDITSHANGIDAVSVSVPGLTDLYADEDEFSHEVPEDVDIVISNDLKKMRYAQNYGNEFLSRGSISRDLIKAADIRLINLIKISERYQDKDLMKKIAENYNYLKDIAQTIRKEDVDIPIREMSDNGSYQLDIDKLAEMPKINIK